MQPVQSPPYGSQFQTASATPPWATDIIEDIKCIKISVSKNDKIEQIVDGINTKVETLETKVKNNDAIVTEVEQSNQFISNGFEETKKKLTSASAEIKKLSTRCTDFEETVSKLETQKIILEEKSNDIESRRTSCSMDSKNQMAKTAKRLSKIL